MEKLSLILVSAIFFSIISCGDFSTNGTEKSTQPIESNQTGDGSLEAKSFNTSAKKVESFGYFVAIWKVKIDSIEYLIGTTSSHAPITVMDKRIIKKKKKKKE